MKEQEKELLDEIERLENYKNFFKKLWLKTSNEVNLNQDLVYNTEKYLKKLNWFQKFIIGYDKLLESNGRIKDNYRRTSSNTTSSTATIRPIINETNGTNKKFEIIWGEGSGEGFY